MNRTESQEVVKPIRGEMAVRLCKSGTASVGKMPSVSCWVSDVGPFSPQSMMVKGFRIQSTTTTVFKDLLIYFSVTVSGPLTLLQEVCLYQRLRLFLMRHDVQAGAAQELFLKDGACAVLNFIIK